MSTDLKVASHKVLRRGNIYTRRLAINLTLDGAKGIDVSVEEISKLPKVINPMRDWVSDFPAWRRLMGAKQPVPAAGVIEVIAMIIQRYAYWPVGFCSWRAGTDKDGPDRPPAMQEKGRAIYEIGAERNGLMAGQAAAILTSAMINGASQAKLHDLFFQLLGEFLQKTNFETPAADAMQIARAGMKKGIAWSPLHRSQYMRLGSGRYSYVLKGSESTNTASISRDLSRNKRLTREMLAEAGLPVARQRTARSEKLALQHARALGFPLVVKPIDGNMGKGVTVGIPDEARLVQAFRKAQNVARRVVIEEQIDGEEYRLLVINGKFVSAMHRSPAQVSADGNLSVRELVETENERPERAPFKTGRVLLMKSIQLDDEAIQLLSDQGLAPDSVPDAGSTVYLRRESNLSRGGEPFDATDLIHPSIIAVAERAASVIGLDVCGVDFITTDPGKNFKATKGAICEVNSRPGINGHLHVMGDTAHTVTDAMLNMLYPDDAPARIPVVVLVGEPRQTRLLRRDIEAIATRTHKSLGAVLSRDKNTILSATRKMGNVDELVWNSDIEAAVIEITPKQLVRKGAGLEYVDLAVIPASDGSELHELAAGAVDRIAKTRVTTLEDPEALLLALKALGLPYDAVASFPARPQPAMSPSISTKQDGYTALFVGDVGFGESYLHRPRMDGLSEILSTHGPGYCLERLKGLLNSADVTIANLEVPLADKTDEALAGRKKYLGWCEAERTATALKEAGINAVTLANNHALDCGTAGLAQTMVHLQKADIAGFGAGRNMQTAARPYIQGFKTGGIERSLVMFGGFEQRPRYNNRYRWYAGSRIAGVCKLNADRIAAQIASLRTTLPNPTFVIFPHWGVDYEELTQGQRDMAAKLVDAGADLIIGHGAHIVQQAEIIKDCPVIYNIGNFIWNTPGRFHKNGVPPYGLAAALKFGHGLVDDAKLRLYPILTDNAQTEFQNRLVTKEEFSAASDLLSGDLPIEFHSGKDNVGHHLELALKPKPSYQPYDLMSASGTSPMANGSFHNKAGASESAPATMVNKKSQFIEMLKTRDGVTVEQMCEKMAWQPNTARAALSGLRKDGYVTELIKPEDGGAGSYRILTGRTSSELS